MEINQVQSLKEENLILKSEVDRLNHIITLFKKQIYGSKAETHETIEEQQVFNDLEVEAANDPQTPLLEEETITYTRKKGRGKKKPFPEDLPREEIVIDIDESDKTCPHDGTLLKQIGFDVTEKLKTKPAQSTVLLEKKLKYACPCCESHLVQAKSQSILPGTIATPELLSFLIFSKFFQSLPFYRIEEFYKLQGIVLSRGTMARWLIQVSEKLIPIYNILQDRVLDSGYMAIDATTVQVLKEVGREPKTKSFMWVRGSPEQGIVLFDYNISGAGRIAKNLTEDFVGGLQADAHKGYGSIEKEKVTLLGCMMHARRRFYKAWVGAKKKSGLAEIGLSMIKRLYKFEKKYKEDKLTPEQRHEARLKEVAPYLEKMQKWCKSKKKKVLPQSPIGNAINYFLNEYEELSGFLKNGRYEIDNGWIERMIRKFAIGRNNWMFNDTVEGAHASSIFYSLCLTAKLNNKDMFKVMTEVFEKLPKADSVEDYEALADLLTK